MISNTTNTDSTALSVEPTKKRNKLIGGAVLALAIAGAAGGIAAAQTPGEPVDSPASVDQTDDRKCALSVEELAAIDAENVGVKAALNAAGFEYTETIDGVTGATHVQWDFLDDAANQAVWDHFDALYPLTDDERAQIVDDANQVRAALDAADIGYTESVDEQFGTSVPVWDYDNEAANAVVEQVYEDWNDAEGGATEEPVRPGC